MTVKLFEGCYGVTRGGEGDPPLVKGPVVWNFDDGWPHHPFMCMGNRWSEDGTRAYGYAVGNIIAVFPTREEAEAHLAGMSEHPKDGGPAFPREYATTSVPGMSLRDWFAGQALSWAGHDNWTSREPAHLAKRAYQMADAMLAARGAE